MVGLLMFSWVRCSALTSSSSVSYLFKISTSKESIFKASDCRWVCWECTTLESLQSWWKTSEKEQTFDTYHRALKMLCRSRWGHFQKFALMFYLLSKKVPLICAFGTLVGGLGAIFAHLMARRFVPLSITDGFCMGSFLPRLERHPIWRTF